MGREIVTLQVGQAGNQIGTAFWDTIRKEHKLRVNGKYAASQPGHDHSSESSEANQDVLPEYLSNTSVFFNPTDADDHLHSTWVPRGVLVDLEPGTLDNVKNHSMGKMFRPDNMVFGQNGAGNNFAKGHYTDGAELLPEIMDRVRREVENCDCPQGFQLMHSLGGGTGSGLGTLLLLTIRDAFPDRITCSYSIFPSRKVSDTVVEPYNAVLASHQLLENCDECFMIDNEALYNIANNCLQIQQPDYLALNSLVAQVTCGVTASLRFPGTLNSDLRKLGVNLVPFPRLHFFLVSHAPINRQFSSDRTRINVQELMRQCFSQRNFFCSVSPEDAPYYAAACIFRGDIPEQEVDDNLTLKLQRDSDQFVEYIPHNLQSALIKTPAMHSSKSATMVANSQALKGIFSRLSSHFARMYRCKAYMHFYKADGMDEMEFQEAEKNVRDLITEYQDYNWTGPYVESDEESNDDSI